jgi:DNA oxidative demethylase
LLLQFAQAEGRAALATVLTTCSVGLLPLDPKIIAQNSSLASRYDFRVAGQAEIPKRAGDPLELFPQTPIEIATSNRERSIIARGAIHVSNWLSFDEQRDLVEQCRVWAKGPSPIHHTILPGGKTMSVQTVALGWHWLPYRYSRFAEDVDGAPVDEFPEWLGDLGRRAVADTLGPEESTTYQPDCALINYYNATAKMGAHKDKEERCDAPVVSLSLGDSCVFRFGNTETRTKPYTDIRLESGDLFVFGGPSRFAYHGVPKIFPGTANPELGMRKGRLNITLRVTGLTDENPQRKATPNSSSRRANH